MRSRQVRVATLIVGIVIGLLLYGVLHRLFWIGIGVVIGAIAVYVSRRD